MNKILIVEADPVLRDALGETVAMAGYSYLAAKDGKEALALLKQQQPLLVLSDIHMDIMDGHQLLSEIQRHNPDIPVILMTAHGNVAEAVASIRKGAVDYLQKPFSAQTLTDTLNRHIKPTLKDVEGEPIANDVISKALLAMAYRVAQSDVGVMITGESGTGKEVLAHYIHHHSKRHHKPFIAINCAAIPEQMLEATLFGYEKGAFTGAFKSTPGKFEQAQGGTLLLDEVSEMSLALQAKLLRVLQEKEVERIGSNQLIELDVRVLATSNRTLLDEVAAARFREDLYYRLNIFPLHWLPLRERKDDILPLAQYLIVKHGEHCKVLPLLSKAAEVMIKEYDWPGNARELENVIQRALVLQTDGIIESYHLQLETGTRRSMVVKDSREDNNLQKNEFAMIEQALKETKGNRVDVAARLGISERTLRYKLAKMREYGYVV